MDSEGNPPRKGLPPIESIFPVGIEHLPRRTIDTLAALLQNTSTVHEHGDHILRLAQILLESFETAVALESSPLTFDWLLQEMRKQRNSVYDLHMALNRLQLDEAVKILEDALPEIKNIHASANECEPERLINNSNQRFDSVCLTQPLRGPQSIHQYDSHNWEPLMLTQHVPDSENKYKRQMDNKPSYSSSSYVSRGYTEYYHHQNVKRSPLPSCETSYRPFAPAEKNRQAPDGISGGKLSLQEPPVTVNDLGPQKPQSISHHGCASNLGYAFRKTRILITWSDDNIIHEDRVMRLTKDMRKNGFAVSQDVPQRLFRSSAEAHKFLKTKFDKCNVVVVCASEKYQHQFEHDSLVVPQYYSIDAGFQLHVGYIRYLITHCNRPKKIIIVLLKDCQTWHIPPLISNNTMYRWPQEYQDFMYFLAEIYRQQG